MARIVMAYVTAKDKQEALALGRTLVEKKLAACTNVWDGMTSCYWWEGKVDTAQEAVLLIKTREDKVEALLNVVKAVHSYSVPCVLTWSVEKGNPDYLKWLDDSLK